MIRITRLNGQPVYLNSELIKLVENSPDTVITLTNGEKIIAREGAEQIAQLVLEVRRAASAGVAASDAEVDGASHPLTAEAARRG